MKNEKTKNIILDLIYDIIGSIFYSISIYTFAKIGNFAPGGISGLALIMNYLWHLPIGLTTLVLNLPLILLSYKIVGKEYLLKLQNNLHQHLLSGCDFPDVSGIYRLPLHGGAFFRYLPWNRTGAVLYEGFFLRWYRLPYHVSKSVAPTFVHRHDYHAD